MKSALTACSISIAILLISPHPVSAEAYKQFHTKYSTIHYSQDKDFDDFLWRIGGERLEIPDTRLVKNRVDRIVDRVQTILDMHPQDLSIVIYLKRGQMEGKVAFYDPRSKALSISVDYASDGVVAHEVAHAIIDQYFAPPPSSRIQEILTQYVDKYLWSDY